MNNPAMTARMFEILGKANPRQNVVTAAAYPSYHRMASDALQGLRKKTIVEGVDSALTRLAIDDKNFLLGRNDDNLLYYMTAGYLVFTSQEAKMRGITLTAAQNQALKEVAELVRNHLKTHTIKRTSVSITKQIHDNLHNLG